MTARRLYMASARFLASTQDLQRIRGGSGGGDYRGSGTDVSKGSSSSNRGDGTKVEEESELVEEMEEGVATLQSKECWKVISSCTGADFRARSGDADAKD